ncbi:MAG TPA: PASTA domain-containing protein [Pyrinomonadaceae bacterium]
MSFIKSGFSAIGKLFIVMTLAATFLVGMGGVVYLSLQGNEIKVPEIVGRDFVDSERELTALGLKIKKRADRFSTEKQNTILEQLPKPGETVKTGQMILVVTSKTNPEGDEAPVTIKKIGQEEEEDKEKIEEMISDKPKKSNKTNTNSASNKKKADTKRDVIANKTDGNSNSNSSANGDSNKNAATPAGNSADKNNKNTTGAPSNKPVNPTAPATKPATGGDLRPRTTPKP